MVHQPQNLTPDEQVAAAKERLRNAVRQVGQDLDRTAGEAQDRLLHTVQGVRQHLEGGVDHLQERLESSLGQTRHQVEDTVSHLRHQLEQTTQGLHDQVQQAGEEMGKAVRGQLQSIRQHPFEAIAVAAITGMVVGHLTSRPSNHRHSTSDPSVADYQPSENFGEPPSSQKSRRTSPTSGIASSVGGVGQMVWDVVRQEYLHPEQIRGWLHQILGKPKRQSQES